MKKEESTNKYTIEITNRLSRFSCSDGEQHVEEMEKRIKNVLSVLSDSNATGTLSDFAVKVALFLADELAHETLARKKINEEMERIIAPMISELERITS